LYNPERSTLLIVDRSFDMQTPLSHDYTYQSLVFELAPPKNFCIDPDSKENQNYLNETDFIWSKYKFAHIVELQKMMQKEV
jgi:syntaxin-binding protein 1